MKAKLPELPLQHGKPRAAKGRYATEREAALYNRERRIGQLEMKIASLEAQLLIERRKTEQLTKTNIRLQRLSNINK